MNTTFTKNFKLQLSLAAVVLSLPMTAAQASSNGAWEYEFTPYVWAAGLDGTLRINDRPADGLGVEQGFSDILKRLDFGLMGAFEARHGRWGLLLDGVYFKVSDQGTKTGARGFASLDAKGEVTQQLYAIAGSYRLNEGPHLVDVLGGLRYNSIKWDLNIAASVPVVPVAERRFSQKKSWVDPYIGARIQHPLATHLSVAGYADIGGFGLGSDLSWQASAAVHYAFTPDMIGKLGYRHVANDYDKDGFTYDVATSGLYMGLGIRW